MSAGLAPDLACPLPSINPLVERGRAWNGPPPAPGRTKRPASPRNNDPVDIARPKAPDMARGRPIGRPRGTRVQALPAVRQRRSVVNGAPRAASSSVAVIDVFALVVPPLPLSEADVQTWVTPSASTVMLSR
jgi:hypothetical protein